MTITIWERIQDALEDLGVPMKDNFYPGSGSQLPNVFIIYLLITGDPVEFFDDEETDRRYHIQITYYNRDGLAAMPDIVGSMLTAGFTHGPDRELPFNLETRHFGLALEFWYTE